jgi:hypothetical protein
LKEVNINSSCFIKEAESIGGMHSGHTTGADFFVDILQSEIEISKGLEEKPFLLASDENTSLFEDGLNWQYETIVAMQGFDNETSDISNNIFPVEISFDLSNMEASQDEDNLITNLTIKVSSQPWFIRPNLYQNNEVTSENNGYFINTNFLLDINQERFNDDNLLDNIQKTFSSVDQEQRTDFLVEGIEIKNCDFTISSQTIHECNSYSYSINEIAATEKYELSNSIRKQVIEAIEVRGINTKDSIEVTLHPEALGNIKIKCELQDKLVINFSFEKLSTLSLLQQSAAELKDIIVKNFHSDLGADINFNMSNNQNSSEYSDNNATSQKLVYHQNDHDVGKIQEAVMYFLNDGRISLVV